MCVGGPRGGGEGMSGHSLSCGSFCKNCVQKPLVANLKVKMISSYSPSFVIRKVILSKKKKKDLIEVATLVAVQQNENDGYPGRERETDIQL